MAHWSIRLRLTIWYSLVLLAGLLLFGGGIWLVISHSLMASLDDASGPRPRVSARCFKPISVRSGRDISTRSYRNTSTRRRKEI